MKTLPDDFDPIAAGYIEREHSQLDPLFALLQEVRDHRQEFEADAAYRSEWLSRVEAELDAIVLHTMRAKSSGPQAPEAQVLEQGTMPNELLTPELRFEAIAEVLADIALDAMKKQQTTTSTDDAPTA